LYDNLTTCGQHPTPWKSWQTLCAD
jgi:hypothetical protein